MPIGIAAAMLGSAAIGATGQIASSALGGGGAPAAAGQTPGFHTSGNAQNSTNDIRQAPMEPLNLKGPGFLKKTNNFLGTQVGGIAKDVAGSFLGDYRQRRNSRNRFKDLRSEGLTAPEIAGSSGGGAVQAQGNTLGSGPMIQAQSQRNFQAGENAKQRAHELEKIEASKEVPRRQASVSEMQYGLRLNLHAKEMQKLHQTVDILEQDVINKKLKNTNFWAILISTMSRENVMASVGMAMHGASPKAILTAIKPTNREDAVILQKVFRDMNNPNAWFYKEFMAILDIYEKVKAGTPTPKPDDHYVLH